MLFQDKLQKGRFLKEFSTFGIGGPIRFFTIISSLEAMREAFEWIGKEKIPFLILGKGSNCLFEDRGFDGLVLLNKIEGCSWEEQRVTVGSGYSFSLLGMQSARRGFSGLEFASGIPATVGGAIFMNAGANGAETCQTLQSVDFLSMEGNLTCYPKEKINFGYRFSSFQKEKGAIISAAFAFSSLADARKKQLALLEKRLKTQPYQEKNIGCIFRNPSPDIQAGRLIDQCGLKGMQIGGAQISSLHANFMINVADAKTEDVLQLMQFIQKTVLEKTGYHLEPEIRVIKL